MPHGGTAQPAVQAEDAHRVVLREGVAGNPVEVGAVGVVEIHGRKTAREHRGVDPVRPAAAVLVVLQLHQRRLDRIGQARDGPRVRVGLLEVVDAPLHQELAHLLHRRRLVHVRRGGGPLDVLDHLEQPLGEVLAGSRVGRAGQLPERGLERHLQGSAQRQQVRSPLQRGVHSLETAVVQLVEHPQRELEVVVGEHVGHPILERRQVRQSETVVPRSTPRGAGRGPGRSTDHGRGEAARRGSFRCTEGGG